MTIIDFIYSVGCAIFAIGGFAVGSLRRDKSIHVVWVVRSLGASVRLFSDYEQAKLLQSENMGTAIEKHEIL